MKNVWQSGVLALLIAGNLVSGAVAAASGAEGSRAAARATSRGGFGFASMLEKSVNLTSEQKDTVRGLLAEQREKTQALRRETDQKIRAVLNPEQQKKFDAMIAEQKAQRANRLARRPS